MTLKQTITTFFEVFNARDMDGMAELLHEDAEFYFHKTQPLIGRERILKFLNLLFRKDPERTIEIQRTVCEGSKAAVHWTNKGRSRKNES